MTVWFKIDVWNDSSQDTIPVFISACLSHSSSRDGSAAPAASAELLHNRTQYLERKQKQMPAVLLHPRYCFVSTGATYALATEVLKTEARQMAAARSYNAVAGESELPGQCVILELKIQFCQYFICCLIGCVSLLHSRNVAWCSVSSNFPGNQVGLCPGIGRK